MRTYTRQSAHLPALVCGPAGARSLEALPVCLPGYLAVNDSTLSCKLQLIILAHELIWRTAHSQHTGQSGTRQRQKSFSTRGQA